MYLRYYYWFYSSRTFPQPCHPMFCRSSLTGIVVMLFLSVLVSCCHYGSGMLHDRKLGLCLAELLFPDSISYLFFRRFTSATSPRWATILLGISSISLLELSSPTTCPLSSTPIRILPPCALAKPQTHFRYSSLQDSLYSIFWFSFTGNDYIFFSQAPFSWTTLSIIHVKRFLFGSAPPWLDTSKVRFEMAICLPYWMLSHFYQEKSNFT